MKLSLIQSLTVVLAAAGGAHAESAQLRGQGSKNNGEDGKLLQILRVSGQARHWNVSIPAADILTKRAHSGVSSSSVSLPPPAGSCHSVIDRQGPIGESSLTLTVTDFSR